MNKTSQITDLSTKSIYSSPSNLPKVIIVVLVVLVLILAGALGILYAKYIEVSDESGKKEENSEERVGDAEKDEDENKNDSEDESEKNEEDETQDSPAADSSAGSKTIKVYFSKDPDSYDDPEFTIAVNRYTDRTDVATFAIEEMLFGPTVDEASKGLFRQIKLTGDSNCKNKDFEIEIDNSANKATIQFCKNITSVGTVADALVITTIEDTLLQFSTVDEVTVLDKDGHCFADESGMDVCLD